jgi:aspartyl-tRNA(Asn)/glutamyl-tRNA(Gln) amidotransferase subunit A
MNAHDALARIRRYDGRLKAFIQVFDPPLFGEPGEGPTVAVKDLIDVAGVPTGGGAKVPLDPAPAHHALVVERLLQAGCSVVGKTHTVELAYGGWGTNRALGAPWNPWDATVHRAPGGSSSGSAVAVAAGLCDVALGTDTGGSVRIPAAICGVVGLKPGRGLVSTRGVHPLSPSLDTVGALARDVATAAQALAMISGPNGAEATRGPFDATHALSADITGWRLAAIPAEDVADLDPDIARLYVEATRRLQQAGTIIDWAPTPCPLDQSFTTNGVLIAGEGWRIWRERIEAHGKLMDPWIVRRFEIGRGVSDERLAEAYLQRKADQDAFQNWIGGYDAILSPTCPIAAPIIDSIDETVSPLSRLTRAANYLDLPGISVPCGLTREGLPVGLQVLGPPRGEAAVVAVGAAFERVSGWNGRTPGLAGFG